MGQGGQVVERSLWDGRKVVSVKSSGGERRINDGLELEAGFVYVNLKAH